jgi:hypothetical protein
MTGLRPADKMGRMSLARRRGGRALNEPEAVDLRPDETIDLRASSAASPVEYHCMSVWGGVRPVRDRAADEWEQAASLVEFPSDLGDRRADLRREDLDPEHLSAFPARSEPLDEP